ncbi:MAG: [citrate (pro-3S)-lyase] ligase [Fusobacteriaceae bacterium]
MKLEKINYRNSFEVRELKEFLTRNGINFDESCDYSVVLRDHEERVVATASKSRNILKCFAIDEKLRGEGVSGQIITAITNRMFEEGYYSSFVFTKSENGTLFLGMGYKMVATTDRVALLEMGISSIEKTLDGIKKKFHLEEKKERAMIVMNCNPFTYGHQYLVEKAAEENEEVLIFVVEEDRSVFPFKVRYDLIRKGTAHLGNVKVIPGTEYIISSATFPNYFLKKEDDSLLEYTKLDVTVAATRFCPAFNIRRRYVGEEPFCSMTEKYNGTIKELFPKYGIEVMIVPRKVEGDSAISATQVRKLLGEGNLEALKRKVPPTTYEFLESPQGREIGELIREKLKEESQG